MSPSSPSLAEISPIAAEARRLRELTKRNASTVEAKLHSASLKRKQLAQAFEARGLKVMPVKYADAEGENSTAIEDLSTVDDSKSIIQAVLRVPVFTAEQAEQVYAVARENGYAVMTSGAKTSALGVFQARQLAQLRGFKGVICIEMDALTLKGISMKEHMEGFGYATPEHFLPTDLLDLPKCQEGEELILHPELPIALLKRSEGKHEVIAHSTMTVHLVNEFLNEQLPDEHYRYQIMPDLTSKKDAAIGGVVNTGAQGGNRTSAKVDLKSVMMVNALGKKLLQGEQAKDIVGYNGCAGTTLQASFEVTPVPKHEFGFVLPIKGKTHAERWENTLKLQALLTPFSVHPDTLSPGEDGKQLHISSMEILGKSPLEMGFEKYADSNAKELGSLTPLLDEQHSHGAEMYVYVTGSSFHGFIDENDDFDEEKLMDFFAEELFSSLQHDEEELFADDDFLALKDGERPYEGVLFIQNPEVLRVMDSVRHSAPEMARITANQLGGQTFSTDMNVRFLSENEKENTHARAKVAKAYAKYVALFDNGPFQVDVYGHLFPGMSEDGGMDPHVRVTLKLNDPATRYNAPELVNFIKKARSGLYKELLALHGRHGVVVTPPEKSHLTNSSYVDHYRLKDPAKLRHLEQTLLGSDPDEAQLRMMDAFRVPHEMPGEPALGMRSLLPADLLPEDADVSDITSYYPALLHMSQHSHRGPQVKALFRETTHRIREQLKLDPYEQFVFFVESAEEADDILKRNGVLQHVVDLSECTDQRTAELLHEGVGQEEVYAIPAEYLGGLPGLTLMVVPRAVVLKVKEKQEQGFRVPGHKNLVDLALRSPYETPETPNILAVAHLGLALQIEHMKDQSPSDLYGQGFTTANPGPVLLNPSIGCEIFTKSLTHQEVADTLGHFRSFLKIPDETALGLTGSSTQCMQLLARALGEHPDVRVVQVTNGAFSERFASILKSEGVATHLYTTPWTTAECSQMRFLLDHFVREIQEAQKAGQTPLLSMTVHKTSTSAHFHPDVLVNALQQRGFIAGVDFEMLFDVTSGLGAIDYFSGTTQKGVNFFGGVQKAMGCPSGLGVFGLSPRMRDALASTGERFSLFQYLQDTEQGYLRNPVAFAALQQKLNAETTAKRSVSDVFQECRQMYLSVLGFMMLHPELERQVTDMRDQSPLELGVYSIERNIPEALAMMERICNMVLGAGYGPFANEAFRLYLPSLTQSQLDEILTAFSVVKEAPEVKYTVNKKAPLVSLREPHDPLRTLKFLITGMEKKLEVDDLIKSSLAINWIWRLKYTFEKGKDTIYGTPENIQAIEAILNTRLWPDEEQRTSSLIETYMQVRSDMETLKKYLLDGNDVEVQLLDGFVKSIFRNLQKVVLILEKYAQHAPRTPEGRVKWPLTATPEQLNGASY